MAGPKWVRLGEAMERRLEAVDRLLIERAAPRPHEAVLDIGCGTGTTSLAMAERVGESGRVVGADISAPMLEAARRRLGGLPNVTLIEADVQEAALPGPFDLAVSRFGVMFFTDPVRAFGAIRAALRPGGRLCAAAWAPLRENPHWQIPLAIAERHMGPGKPRHPHAPGPMALADADYAREILGGAGFRAIEVTAEAVPVFNENLEAAARDACIMGPAGALLDEKQAEEAAREAIEAEVRAAFRPYDTGEAGAPLRLPATVFILRAEAPERL